MSTVLRTTLDPFNPTLDVSKISMREAFALYQVMASVSDLLNAAHNGRSAALVQYLDNWQALTFAACSDLADIVHAMKPTEGEKADRNFLLVNMRLRIAEGPVDISGAGAPDRWEGSAK